MAGSTSVDPLHCCMDAYFCVPVEARLLKGNAATTTIQPYGLPRMELNPRVSLEVSVMNSEDEGEAEPDDIAGREHNIRVLGIANCQLLNSSNCLKDKVDFLLLNPSNCLEDKVYKTTDLKSNKLKT